MMLSLISLCYLSLNTPSYADIYTYHDKAGHLYFTDKRMNAGYKLLSVYRPKLTLKSTQNFTVEKYSENKRKFTPLIRLAAIKYRMNPDLISAIIDTESAFNPKALSKTGAVGLMQLMPTTAKELGVSNRLNPSQNIQGGTKYFSQLMRMFDQNIKLSLAAYNAGPNAVKRAGNQIPNYPETQRYVKKVMQQYEKLKRS